MTAPAYQYIQENPHRLGPSEALIVQYNVPVWALIGHLKAIGWDSARAAQDYAIPEEFVLDAIRYYKQYTQAIDARLQANTAASVEGESE